MTDESAAAPPSALAKANFGRLDAEQDANLLQYFVEVGTASDALRGKYLIIGRKGAGKTALFKHVAAKAGGRVIELDLEGYVFQAHKALLESGLADAFSYTASWRFAIAISMFLESRRDLGFWTRRRGMKIVRKIGAGPSGGPFVAIAEWLRRVRKVDLPSVTGVAALGGIELGDVPRKFMDSSTARLLDDLESLLAREWGHHPMTVLIDRLDDAWDGSEDSLRLIGGAARAARHFASLAESENMPAPVIVFLRTDLWERVAFNDKNKFGQDTIYLDWVESDLSRVIDARVHRTAGVPEGAGWATVFTSDRMRQQTTAKNYMLKRVLGRPRDIVAFSIFAREVAIGKGHTVIEGTDIYDAEVRYSKHVVDELRDEINEHVSNPVSVINAMKGLGRRTFTLAAWGEAAVKNGIAADEVDGVLDQLFEASVIGVYRAGGSGGGSKTFYRYQDRFLKATETGQLQVHPALVKELGLIDA